MSDARGEAMGEAMGEAKRAIAIGPAGWSYPDWKGVVYPRSPGRGFDALRYLAAYFDVIEINSSFYRPPTEQVAERWVESVEGLEGFRFTAKVPQGLTHEKPASWEPGLLEAFRAGVEVLRGAGRLGALLAQFPFWFDATPEALEHLRRLRDALPEPLPLVVELRHRSFVSRRMLEELSRLRLSFCNVDQPLAKSSIEPGARVTGPIGYFRCHGRNADAWFRKGAGRDEKYDYLYTAEELRRFLPLLREIEARTEVTYVVMNNHFLGKGPANALELAALVSGAPREVPPDLVRNYPRLGSLERRDDEEPDAQDRDDEAANAP